jgi:hypothetical protein
MKEQMAEHRALARLRVVFPVVSRVVLSVMIFVLLFSGVLGVGSCEVVDYGNLAVTWRFNGEPLISGSRPCTVMNANAAPPPAGLVRIEMDGPSYFVDYVACTSTEMNVPLRFYEKLVSPPDVYARIVRDVPAGRYDVTVSFVDRNGEEITDPAPIVRRVRIGRSTARIDCDFPLTYGRVDIEWDLDSGEVACSEVGAEEIRVELVDEADGVVAERVLSCEQGRTGTYPFVGIEPGSYRAVGQLLGSQGDPVGQQTEASEVIEVARAEVAEATISFDATALGL